MCGRYVLYDFQELSERLTDVWIPPGFLERLFPTWNAAPSQVLPVVIEESDRTELRGMHWGLTPKWTKPGEHPKVKPINARAETIGEKPMFRSLARYRRCIVPANGFYEWGRLGNRKQPWYIHPTGGQLLLFAGLYDEATDANGDPIESFTIVTTSANETVAALHDRMPVILEPADVEAWLDRDVTDLGPVEHLLRPAPNDAVEMHPVSREVNSARNNGADLIEPVDDQNDR